MTTRSKFSEKILWATIEDYVGLWEILWEISSLVRKSFVFESRKIVQQLLIEFFEKGMIEFFFCKEPYGNLEKISSHDEVLAILKKEKYWHEPKKNEISIRIGSTEKGQEYYEMINK